MAVKIAGWIRILRLYNIGEAYIFPSCSLILKIIVGLGLKVRRDRVPLLSDRAIEIADSSVQQIEIWIECDFTAIRVSSNLPADAQFRSTFWGDRKIIERE
jgi:hypothetical protein